MQPAAVARAVGGAYDIAPSVVVLRVNLAALGARGRDPAARPLRLRGRVVELGTWDWSVASAADFQLALPATIADATGARTRVTMTAAYFEGVFAATAAELFTLVKLDPDKEGRKAARDNLRGWAAYWTTFDGVFEVRGAGGAGGPGVEELLVSGLVPLADDDV